MGVSTLVDLVKIQVQSSGVGPFELGPPVPGYRGVEALIDSAIYSYSVQNGSSYEVGTGVYLASTQTLVRTPTVSSAGNAVVAFPANVQVNFTALADDLLATGGTLPIVDAEGDDPGLAISQRAASDGLSEKARAAALGITGSSGNMGTTPGTILSDNGTAKQWFQESEAAIEERVPVADLASGEIDKGSALVGHYIRTAKERLDDAISLDDHIAPEYTSNPVAVHDGLSEAILRASNRTRKVAIPSFYAYAQPDTDITLNDIEIVGAKLTRPPYSTTTDYMPRFKQTDMTRPLFKIGKNVSISGIAAYSPGLTDAAANAAIAAAGAVTDLQKKAALDALWGGSSPLFVPQDAGNMEFCTFEDITVERCWKFMSLGGALQYQAAGKVNLNNITALSVATDFIGKQCAEICTLSNGFFGAGVAPDGIGPTSPLREYMARWGVFFKNDCGGSFYPSFDGFAVSDTFLFGKRAALLAKSGRLDITRWSNVQIDATSFGIYIDNGGQVVGSSFDLRAYSYRFPVSTPDPDFASKPVVLIASTQAAAPGPTDLIIELKSQYSSGPVVKIEGDHFNQVDFVNLNARNFGAGGAVDAIAINNPNAVVTADGMVLRGQSGNTTDSGLYVASGRFEAKGAHFDTCAYSVAQTGGTVLLDNPASTNTVIGDITQSGGHLDVRNPRWSKPNGFRGNCSFRAAGGPQTFNSGTATVKTFATEIFDHHADFNPATGAFTAAFVGPHTIAWTLTHDATGTAGDRWLIQIVRNGSEVLSNYSYKMIADVNTVSFATDVSLSAGDIVDIRVQRVGGSGAFVTISDNSMNWFAGSYNYG